MRHLSQIARAFLFTDFSTFIIRSLYTNNASISKAMSFLIRCNSPLRNSMSLSFSNSRWSVSSLLVFTISLAESHASVASAKSRSDNSLCVSEHWYLNLPKLQFHIKKSQIMSTDVCTMRERNLLLKTYLLSL